MKKPSLRSIHPKHFVAAIFAFLLLTGAVVSTSSVAQLSYQSAQLQAQELALKEQRQLLQEQLAQAHALSTSLSFAKEQGFSQSIQAGTQLDVTPSLAQAR